MASKATTTLIIVGLVCFAGGAASGYYGRGLIRKQPTGNFANGGRPTFNGQQTPGKNNGQFRGNTVNSQQGRPIAGTIQTATNDNLTIKTPDGSSKIILLTSDTKFNKITSGTASDFPTGSQVIVMGKEGSDGSVTAATIQAAPQPSSPTPSTTP